MIDITPWRTGLEHTVSLTPEENRHAVLLHVVRDKTHVRDMHRRLRLEVRYILYRFLFECRPTLCPFVLSNLLLFVLSYLMLFVWRRAFLFLSTVRLVKIDRPSRVI